MLIENHQTKQEVIIEHIFKKIWEIMLELDKEMLMQKYLRKTERSSLKFFPALSVES